MTTREQIIAAAREAGCSFPLRSGWGDCRVPTFFSMDGLEAFYAIAFEAGRSSEREECAQTCEEYQGSAETCSAAIRARGEVK